MKFVTSIGIIGNFYEDWEKIQDKCDQFATDNAGIAVGILLRRIKTDFGSFPIKFVLLFIDKSLTSQLKPTYRYSMSEILKEGLENILLRVGKKLIINTHLKAPKGSIINE